MDKFTVKYEITQENKKVIKGKIRLYFPNSKGISKYIKKLSNGMEENERLFVMNMIRFHFLFPVDDIFKDKYIEYNELQYMLNSKQQMTTNINNDYEKLIYKSLMDDKIFKLNMSKEDYEEFKAMILNEISQIELEYSEIIDKEFLKLKNKQNIIKRIKLRFRNKELNKFKKDLIENTIKEVNRDAIENDAKKDAHKFDERAYRLLENFDNNEYANLIKEITEYIKKDYLECNELKEFEEEIEYINSGKNNIEKNDILLWICTNMSSRKDALDAMRLDASYIYDQILNKYYREEYRKIRKKLNYEEKRLFQALFFGRKAFLYKIPALTKFLNSFYIANHELVFLGLILKRSNPEYEKNKKELEKKWYEFLNMYSIGIKNYSIIESMKDSERIKQIIKNKFNDQDSEILEAILENYSYDIIQARFDKSEIYISNLVKSLQQIIREESDNEFAEQKN